MLNLTNMNAGNICSILAVVVALSTNAYAETIEDYLCQNRFHGCKFDYKERQCLEGNAVACFNPFPYKDFEECLQDITGHGNICDKSNPCKNGGVCSPVTTIRRGRTFKCECASTGFFGRRCHHKCPKDLSDRKLKKLPCVEI